jgi:hypothetical protein
MNTEIQQICSRACGLGIRFAARAQPVLQRNPSVLPASSLGHGVRPAGVWGRSGPRRTTRQWGVAHTIRGPANHAHRPATPDRQPRRGGATTIKGSSRNFIWPRAPSSTPASRVPQAARYPAVRPHASPTRKRLPSNRNRLTSTLAAVKPVRPMPRPDDVGEFGYSPTLPPPSPSPSAPGTDENTPRGFESSRRFRAPGAVSDDEAGLQNYL